LKRNSPKTYVRLHRVINTNCVCFKVWVAHKSMLKWRDFCNKFEDKVDDFNFATLFRLDASKGYNEDNTCIVPRIQFLALEIARNRQGVNKSELLRKLQE
uniref:Polysacc_synt_4 domain-containing protein n=1 Tax=Echinostoma caproni TaxID=27848 RepID=A0A183ASV3_9TREM